MIKVILENIGYISRVRIRARLKTRSNSVSILSIFSQPCLSPSPLSEKCRQTDISDEVLLLMKPGVGVEDLFK